MNHMVDGLRIPPQAIEAEQSVIGSLMINELAVEDVIEILNAQDFYRHDHKIIFSEVLRMFQSGEAVDVVTVSESLTKSGQLEDCGGLSYLGSLAKNTPNTGNVKAYARVVEERSKRRKIIEACQAGISAAYESADANIAINKISNEIEAVSVNDTGDRNLAVKQITPFALNELEARLKSDSPLVGFSTGLTDLDAKTAGLCRGDLVIVGARPSMGKTAFSFSLLNPCLKNGGRAKVFSMEMGKVQLYNRMWAEASGVSLKLIRQPKQLDTDQWARLTAASQTLNDLNLSIDDESGLNLNQIRTRCRKEKRSNGLDIVVVDYLQLMQLSGEGNKADQVGDVTKGLKIMARELDVVVVCLSQLNRSLEQRPNKRPVMSDLRDSGSIEADADLIFFLYRDEVYNPDTDQTGICEIDTAKQRNGEIGRVRCVFQGELQRFSNFVGYR